jgi:xanthine permease XanP
MQRVRCVYVQRLQGGLLADGLNSAVGACLNSFPSTTFAQNNGVIQLTGVGSRYVGIFIGGIRRSFRDRETQPQ